MNVGNECKVKGWSLTSLFSSHMSCVLLKEFLNLTVLSELVDDAGEGDVEEAGDHGHQGEGALGRGGDGWSSTGRPV